MNAASTDGSLSDARLVINGAPLEKASLVDFWSWAFGDLCDDDIKGIFAEWMVARLLGLQTQRRVSWANSDLVTPSGKRIEVKATSYWQSWKLVNPDGTPKPDVKPIDTKAVRIQFGGLRAGDSVSPVRQTGGTRALKSDIYVFCFHTQADPADWNAWNLDDWQFHVLEAAQLEVHKIGRTISVKKLEKICPAMKAADFQQHMRERL